MKSAAAILVGAVIFLVIGACGGGSSAPLVEVPTGPPPSGTINTGSVLTVAGRSVDAALHSGSFGDITDVVGLTVAADAPGSSGSRWAHKPAAGSVQSQVPFGPEVIACAVDGTVTVTGDIASPLTVTAGDFLDYVWADCDEGFDQVLSGLIGMTFTDFEGDLLAGRILLGVSLEVQDFRVSDSADFSLTDGDLTLTIDSREQPRTEVMTLGNSLVFRDSSGTETLSNFSSMVIEDTSMFPSNFTTDVTGRASSTRFGGFVNYETPVAFQSTGDGFPYAGEMRISGANNSSIRIIALNEVSVRIEADYNGDGGTDATIDTSWDALVNR